MMRWPIFKGRYCRMMSADFYRYCVMPNRPTFLSADFSRSNRTCFIFLDCQPILGKQCSDWSSALLMFLWWHKLICKSWPVSSKISQLSCWPTQNRSTICLTTLLANLYRPILIVQCVTGFRGLPCPLFSVVSINQLINQNFFKWPK